jgi:hypothetical protein
MGVSIAFDALRSSAQLCLRLAAASSIVVLFTTIALSSALGQQQIGEEEGDLPSSLFAPPFYFVQSLLPPGAISCFCENLGDKPGYYCLYLATKKRIPTIGWVGPPSLCPPVHVPFVLGPSVE